MKLNLATVLAVYLLAYVPPVLAATAPSLLSPPDGSTVTNLTLNWQTPSYPLYSPNPYRVQVDNDSSFASPYRDYYTSNTSYAPNLTDGLWYWRVRAKDESGTTGDWSSSWSFTLSPATSTPSPTPTPQPTTTPAPSPSPGTSSVFNISTDRSSINSDDILTVTITITGLDPNTKYFLKGAFIKSGSLNYFGKTLVSGSWVKNSQTYSSQFPVTADSAGTWNGSIQVMPDPEDNGLAGSGSYVFKAGRYTEGGSSPIWSNAVNINITDVAGSGSTASSTPKPSASTTAKSSMTPFNYGVSGSSQAKINHPIPDIAGVSTNSSEPAFIGSDKKQLPDKKNIINIWLLGTGFLVLIGGAGVLFYPKLKQKGIIIPCSIQNLLGKLKSLPKN